MKVETVKKSICINRIVTQKIENFILEEDTIIPDIKPDILKAVSTSGNVCIYRKEVLDGKIKLDGNVNVYLIYLADSETDIIRGINTNIDFKQIIECKDALNGMNVNEKVTIKSIECKVLNGRKVSLSIQLEAEVILYANEDLDIVNDVQNIKDIQEIRKNIRFNSVVGSNSTKTYAKETIKIDSGDNLAEILRVDFNIINKDSKMSYNKILAKADADVKIMYITEDNRIRNIEEKIPIMGFVEMLNVSENDICDTKYTIRNILVKPNSEEEHSIYVEIELDVSCNAIREEEIEILEDLYSPSMNLEFNSRNILTMVDKKNRNDVYEIREKMQIQELVGEKIRDIRITPIINSANISRGKIKYDGEVKVDFLITSNNQTTVEGITKTIPIMYVMDYEEVIESSKIDTNVEIAMQDFVIEDSEVTLNINLSFEVSQYNQINMNVIENVSLNEEKCIENPYSMTIYFVKSGDSLWKIAKKYRSTIEDIMRLNEIEDPDKIDVGMQLFIPKYVCTKSN